MKKRLLTFFAFALTALMVNAQSWAKPEIKLTTDQVPEKAYIYNVESNMFLTKGGAWGNHASVKPDVSVAFLYEMQAQGEENTYKLHCSAAANNGILGRQSIEDVYTDWKAQADWGLTWEFIPVTGGFIIRNAASDPQYGANKYTDDDPANYGLYILGYNPERDDLEKGSGDPMGTHEGIYMVDPDDAEGYTTLWAFMTEADYAAYNAQMALYNKLIDALEEGYTEAELAEQAALLSSTDIDAVNAAVAVVTQMVLDYGYTHATPENPFDVTDVIKNPGFDGTKGGTPANWECTNAVLQNNSTYVGWDEETGATTESPVFNCQIEQWTSGTAITSPADVHQVLVDLPQGTYRLTGWCIATSGTAGATPEGAELYAQSGSVRYATTVAMTNGEEGSGYPHLTTVEITHFGGDLTIGYSYTPGSVKWWAADNFRLYYCGPVNNPGLVALQAVLGTAEPYIDEYDELYVYSDATKTELEQAISDANSVIAGGDSDECQAQTNVIANLLTQVKAEISAYANLDKFATKVLGDVDKYPFIEELGDMADDYRGAYDDNKATVEEIEAWIAAYDDFVKNAIKAAMKDATEENPIEITPLFANLGFEENETESATPNNWTCDASAFKARVNTAEVWQATFDAYTVLNDLPAGAYKITAHGLARSGSSVENYNTNGEGITAEFYANNASVKVKDQALGAGAEQLYGNDVNLTGDEENPLWVPNSMEGARVYFNVENTPYVNEVTANLVNDGDPLRIGFRDMGNGDGTIVGNSWTIWSDVRVFYIGVSKNELYNEMVAIAQSTYDMEDKCLIEKGCSTLSDARDAADKLSSSSSEEEITNAINNLTDAIKYYNDGKALVNEVINLSTSGVYDEVLNNYEVSGESELSKILDELNEAITDEEFESNEQIEGWLKALPGARTAHIFAAVVTEQGLTPTEEEPADVTDVMTNPSFATNNATGWTVSNTGGSVGGGDAQRQGSTAYEMWNGTAFDIHQVVPGLPEGYYTISVKALYRNENNGDAVAAEYFANPDSIGALAKFYANDTQVNVKSIFECAQAEDPAIDGQASYVYDGVTYYTPNTMISFENYAMDLNLYDNVLVVYLDGKTDLKVGLCYETTAAHAWFPFDDFKIAYMGTQAPTAIEGVEADAIMAGKVAIFSINGQQQSRLQKGVNIVRKADGKVVKLLVK